MKASKNNYSNYFTKWRADVPALAISPSLTAYREEENS